MPGHALLRRAIHGNQHDRHDCLGGIIVRNSILLVDLSMQVAQRHRFKEAVVQSAITRAQPIALTGFGSDDGGVFILDDPIFNGSDLADLGIFLCRPC